MPTADAVLRFLRRNGLPALASLALALVIWFLITDSQNATIEERLGFGLAVEAVNTPGGLATANRLPTASIIVRGREEAVRSVGFEDFEARVDLGGLAAGTHEVPLQVRSRVDGVRVRAVTPETMEVVLEPVVERQFPVTVQVTSTPPAGYEVGEVLAAPGTVTISGIRQLVDLVDTAVASVDVQGLTVDVDLSVNVQVRTSIGAAVSGLTILPPTVVVSVPIDQVLFRRTVAVRPDLTGAPAPGFRLAAITVNPLTVEVVGPLEALEGVQEILTTPVSLEAARSTFVTTAPLIAPSGLVLARREPVILEITIASVGAVATFDVPVAVTALGPGLAVAVSPATVQVTVAGPAAAIGELTPASFRATVVGTDLGDGAYFLPVQVGFVTGVDVVAVEPEAVTLEIFRESGGGP